MGVYVGEIAMRKAPPDRIRRLVVMLFTVFMVSACEEIAESACESRCEDKYNQCMDDGRTAELTCQAAYDECYSGCQIPD